MPLAVRTRNEPAFKGEATRPFGAPPARAEKRSSTGLEQASRAASSSHPNLPQRPRGPGAAPGGPLTLPSRKGAQCPPTGAAL